MPMWERSPTPEEIWNDASGGNEDTEWPVLGIVGEEVCLDGTSRYEIRWENWSRADGSNTTWQADVSDVPEILRRWKRAQHQRLSALVANSLDMKVRWPNDAIHQRPTEQRAQAYEKKKQLRTPLSTALWDQEVQHAYGAIHGRDAEDGRPHLRVRRDMGLASPALSGINPSATPAPSLKRRRVSSPVQPTSTLSQGSLLPTIAHKPKERLSLNSPAALSRAVLQTSSTCRPTIPSQEASQSSPGLVTSRNRNLYSAQDPSPSQTSRALSLRIEQSWTRAAKEVMAVGVKIHNSIADEDIPMVLRKFIYIEKGYVFDRGLRRVFEVTRHVFTACDCSPCLDASKCGCQSASEIRSDQNRRVFAYSKGLFRFNAPRGVEVIECNKYCSCGTECRNRVAQLPRNIEIEIFDTGRCGWGARTLATLPRGKVVGTFTGKLIRRENADKLPDEHQGYLFDLDGTEVKNSENLGDKYTVDAYEFGNWTRFVNHSCSPNMIVYSAVYDTIPHVNMPYLTFVACQNIPAGTELTIDYQPYALETHGHKKRHSSEPCKCGSQRCRGWYRI